MKKYTKKECEGLLFWCLGYLIEGLESVVKTFPNNKPLRELNKEEFVVENASHSLVIACGQLEDMGIDYKRLIELVNRFGLKQNELFDFVKVK